MRTNRLLAGMRGATALSFAVLMKHYSRHGSVPRGRSEVPDDVVAFVGRPPKGTASAEAIPRRFTRSASHPSYQAMLEVGRAQRTIFVARYLRSRELQREITEGLNVVEVSNGANAVTTTARAVNSRPTAATSRR